MLITHEIDIDLTKPGTVPRISVKQGDVMTRNVCIHLFANATAWNVPAGTAAVIRYCAYDADGHTISHGMYDTLEDDSPAFLFSENALEIMLHGDMMANPGLVNVDVLLAKAEKKLGTFCFEIYVNRAVTES